MSKQEYGYFDGPGTGDTIYRNTAAGRWFFAKSHDEREAKRIVNALNAVQPLTEALDLAIHELKVMRRCINSVDGCAGDWSDHLQGINSAIRKASKAKRTK